MNTPYRIIFQASLTAIILMIGYLGLHLLPFNWFVDIDYVYNDDVCLGENTQTVRSEREIMWPITAHVYAQVVKIEGVKIIETTIYRDDLFGYEESGYTEFEIKWNNPFTETGIYGVNSWVDIKPLPFITVKEFTPYTESLFEVVECDI